MMVAERRANALDYEIDPAVQEELLKHPGKWASLTRSKIIAIRDSSVAAYKAALKAGVEAPILYHIPDNRTGYSYF